MNQLLGLGDTQRHGSTPSHLPAASPPQDEGFFIQGGQRLLVDYLANLSHPLQITTHVQTHIKDLTDKGREESDSSSDELDSFSFKLTQEEVKKVCDREFLDFAAIFHRQQRVPYGLGEVDLHPSGGSTPDMLVKELARIFLAFQAENDWWHLKESTALPAYGDLILKMEHAGMVWAKYDVIFCQKRAKQIVRKPRKVKSWSVTDIELYLCCEAPWETLRSVNAKRAPFAATQQQGHQSSSEGHQFKSGRCWKFQSAKGCEGPRLQSQPPSQSAIRHPNPKHFRQSEAKVENPGQREDHDRR